MFSESNNEAKLKRQEDDSAHFAKKMVEEYFSGHEIVSREAAIEVFNRMIEALNKAQKDGLIKKRVLIWS